VAFAASLFWNFVQGEEFKNSRPLIFQGIVFILRVFNDGAETIAFLY